MTVELSTPTQRYTVAGTGPYALPWPYASDGVAAVIETTGGVRIGLVVTDNFSVSPASSTTVGDLFLTPAAAALHAGAVIVIERSTIAEQGWQGLMGARERGLEAQLDRTVMTVQELSARQQGTLRVAGTLNPFVWDEGTVPILIDGQPASGPTAADITQAQDYAERAEAAAASITGLSYGVVDTGTADGTNGPFALSQNPGLNQIVDFYADGKRLDASEYAVVAMATPSGVGVQTTVPMRDDITWIARYWGVVNVPDSLNTALSFSTREDFVAAVAAGITVYPGYVAFARGWMYIVETGYSGIVDLPGWRAVNVARKFTLSEVQATTFLSSPDHDVILVAGAGNIVTTYIAVAAATDLITGDLRTWVKGSITLDDAIAIGTEVANSMAVNGADISFPSGTAAAPAIKSASFLDTGMFFPLADQVGLATNGVQRVLLSDAALQLDVALTGSAVQASATDASAGRVLLNGAHGLGSTAVTLVTDYNVLTVTGFYRNNAVATGAPTTGLYYSVLHIAHSPDGTASQLALRSAGVVANEMWLRRKAAGTWSAWDKVFHSGNLLYSVPAYGGTANAITLTTGSRLATLPAGLQLRFRATAANTGPATVAVDGLTAVAIKTITGAALPAGYIRTDANTVITYDGTNFIADRQIESGANWTKWADGTMWCVTVSTGQGPISTASGSSFIQSPGLAIGALPVTFIAAPARSVDVFQPSGVAAGIQSATAPTTTTGGTVQMIKAVTASNTDFTITATFTGRWF